MNCPNCGAAMRLEADRECLSCTYCQTVHFPEPDEQGVRVLEELSAEKCPICATALVHAATGGIRILYCGRCRGMLIPMANFLALIQALRAERAGGGYLPRPAGADALKRRIHCPRCSEYMETHPYYGGPGNVVIDNCAGCGLNWLDHSELRRIVESMETV